MKINDVLFLGYFGYQTNQLDGQTIKTRNVYCLLKSKEMLIGKVGYFDTQQFQQNKLSVFTMLYKVIRSKRLIYIPAYNNLKYIFPFLFLISQIFNTKIIYIVVGGWLSEYLKNKPLHKYLLKKVKIIMPQTNTLKNHMVEEFQFENVLYFPNFRNHSFSPNPAVIKNSLRIVFMARVTKLKGIDILFELSEFLKDNYYNKDVYIDIYGPVNETEKDCFYQNIERNDKISYKGIVEPKDVYNTLSCYDLMILPTRYPGEGFPGSILDAYISGIPVIATNWKQIPEFIDVGITGYLFDIRNTNRLFHYIELLYNDSDLLLQMKKNAFEKSKQFTSKIAWEIIKPYLVD